MARVEPSQHYGKTVPSRRVAETPGKEEEIVTTTRFTGLSVSEMIGDPAFYHYLIPISDQRIIP